MTLYLVDTDVISESRKGDDANAGVRAFFHKASREDQPPFISTVTVGELRRGVERLRHRSDARQANRWAHWLLLIVKEYGDAIRAFDAEIAQVWGRQRVPHSQNPPWASRLPQQR